MLEWVKRRVQRNAAAAAKQDIMIFLDMARGNSDSENGSVIALATGVRIQMGRRGILPLDSLDINSDMDIGTRANVGLRLNSLVKQFQKDEVFEIATGAMVWLHSVRALYILEIRYLGRELWKELARGFPCAEDRFKEAGFIAGIYAHEVSGDDLTFIPNGLEPF